MTVSEDYFDLYLKDRRIKFEIEKGTTVHPDRFLHIGKKTIICEVHQLERHKGEPINYVGSFDPFTDLRNAIKRKVRQGKEAKESKIPYVIVLFDYGSRVMMSRFTVEGAMYGNPNIVIDVPQDPQKKGKVRGTFFGANGIIRHARSHNEPGQPFNKRISAVAILEHINPTERIFHAEYKKASKGVEDLLKNIEIAEKVGERLEKAGLYKKDLFVPRLTVFHNFYSENPVGFKVFNGRYDKQYYIDNQTGASQKYKIKKTKSQD